MGLISGIKTPIWHFYFIDVDIEAQSGWKDLEYYCELAFKERKKKLNSLNFLFSKYWKRNNSLDLEEQSLKFEFLYEAYYLHQTDLWRIIWKHILITRSVFKAQNDI